MYIAWVVFFSYYGITFDGTSTYKMYFGALINILKFSKFGKNVLKKYDKGAFFS